MKKIYLFIAGLGISFTIIASILFQMNSILEGSIALIVAELFLIYLIRLKKDEPWIDVFSTVITLCIGAFFVIFYGNQTFEGYNITISNNIITPGIIIIFFSIIRAIIQSLHEGDPISTFILFALGNLLMIPAAFTPAHFGYDIFFILGFILCIVSLISYDYGIYTWGDFTDFAIWILLSWSIILLCAFAYFLFKSDIVSAADSGLKGIIGIIIFIKAYLPEHEKIDLNPF